MHRHPLYRAALAGLLLVSQARGQAVGAAGSAPDGPLQAPALRLSDPLQRERTVQALGDAAALAKANARIKAAALDLPAEMTWKNGRRKSLMAFKGDRPRYLITHNANAAISTGANILQTTPWSLTGGGFTFGLWDGGSALSTHQELTGRVTVKDGAAADDHATHVGGTLIASGIRAAAKGMAPDAKIDSYDWDNDVSEMTSRAATYPGESGKLYISNQSYGYSSGWDYVGDIDLDWQWLGTGTGVTGADSTFGQYDSYARDDDSLAANAPYFLMFRSAGNDREDNPQAGDIVALSTTTTHYVSYNPATHPPGDGVWHGGFETISSDAVAKNIVCVGSVGDAVNSGVRDISGAYMSDYSCWGPTDDGRIKPDLVANGEDLTSSVATSNTSYDTYSGTSMSSPNAAGSAMLLVQLYDRLYPGQAMRASTLKGLLIQTCDDLGNPGPDYRYGWGLENVQAAATLLQDQSTNPDKLRLWENQVNVAHPSRTVSFTWDGLTPIKATLCWTDPAGTASTTTDSRTARLVNDLNLHVTGPDGTVYRPFVMPFVGVWTQASMDAAATTGVNHTDNVEQVLISSPPSAGIYQVVVDFSGTLSGNAQTYSVLINGSTAAPLPAPTLTAATPAQITGGPNLVAFAATGTGFQTGATVALTQGGASPVTIKGLQVIGESITGFIDASAIPAGTWNVVVTNPDGQSATLAAAVTTTAALWSETFENGVGSWTHSVTSGSADVWALTTTNPHSATHCFRAPAPSSTLLDNLVSPVIPIPANYGTLTFSFWHQYTFTTGDGAVLEISADGGTTWNDITAAASGASFIQTAYNGVLPSGNSLAGRQGWTGSSGAYVQTVLSLNASTYAGKNLRLRWRLATNGSTSSTGWYVDDMAVSGAPSTVSFAQWQAAHFPSISATEAQETADPDGDGLTNLAEYALGTDPNAFTASPLAATNSDESLTLSFTRPTNVEGVTYHAEISTDMVAWTEVTLTAGAASEGVQTMQAVLPAGTTSGFIRLRLEH